MKFSIQKTISVAALLACVVPQAFAAQQATWTLLEDDAQAQSTDGKFVAPVSSPYYHEDSFVTNDVRAWYVYQNFPNSNGVGKVGGDATVAALQLRLALTNNVQFVAYKDGWVDIDGGELDEGDGLNDIGAGLKFAFIQDHANALFAAGGLGAEIPVGDDEVFQGTETYRAWVSVNKGFDKLHLGATLNYFYSYDSWIENVTGVDLGDVQTLSWHLHADYQLTENFSPVVEVNGYYTLNGVDFAGNLPLQVGDIGFVGGGHNEDLITAAFGAEYRLGQMGAVRAAYELPLTGDSDLFGERITASYVLEF